MFMFIFTRVNYYRSCGSDQEYNPIWQWLTILGWFDISALYCTIVVIWVAIKLFSLTRNIDNPVLINKTVVSNIVKRVILYPVVPMMPMLISSIIKIYSSINSEVPFTLKLFHFIGISLQGTFLFYSAFYYFYFVTKISFIYLRISKCFSIVS